MNSYPSCMTGIQSELRIRAWGGDGVNPLPSGSTSSSLLAFPSWDQTRGLLTQERMPHLGLPCPLPCSEDYKRHFFPRDLRAFAMRPLLAFPTHYAGDAQWLSDTETSTIWDDDTQATGWSGSQKTMRDPRLDRVGSSGHSLHSTSHDEL